MRNKIVSLALAFLSMTAMKSYAACWNNIKDCIPKPKPEVVNKRTPRAPSGGPSSFPQAQLGENCGGDIGPINCAPGLVCQGAIFGSYGKCVYPSSANVNENSGSWTQTHDSLRAKHGSHGLSWNPDIAEHARAWANMVAVCQNTTIHSMDGLYAQNIAYGYDNEVDATNAWYSEISSYNFNTHASTGGEVGHFENVVWNDTVGFGCATANVPQPCQVCAADPNGITRCISVRNKVFVCDYQWGSESFTYNNSPDKVKNVKPLGTGMGLTAGFGYQRIDGWDIPGYDMYCRAYDRSFNLGSCQAMCNSDSRCTAFNHVTGNPNWTYSNGEGCCTKSFPSNVQMIPARNIIFYRKVYY
ncbi:MAG: hypothetical protein HQK54_04455 [Oligoflexales bacterium]|nr:hypothetical protein [Oligoflexales bacterium]